ncbi:MAG: hypothetical protein PQJ46_05470 [Spirochaetales bacterium]|nr:hypothetical protein [Spirochaetales bacterium]
MDMELFKEIKRIITENFTEVNVEVRYDNTFDEIFIIIDNLSIYYSKDFEKIRLNIFEELIWPKSISNIFFIYEQGLYINELNFNIENKANKTFVIKEDDYKISCGNFINIYNDDWVA